jgi:hypothetical protein
MAARQRRALALAGERDLDGLAGARHLADLRLRQDLHAVARQSLEHHRHEVGVLVGERRHRLEHDDFAAEPPVRLGKLQPDRSGADDDEAPGAVRLANTVSLVR